MKVLCTNDYPYKALPPATTDEQANALTLRLNDLEAAEHSKGHGGLRPRVYYHWHEIPEEKPEDIKPWGTPA